VEKTKTKMERKEDQETKINFEIWQMIFVPLFKAQLIYINAL